MSDALERLCADQSKRLGAALTRLVDAEAADELVSGLAQRRTAVCVESLGGMPVSFADLRAQAANAHELGLPLVVGNSLATSFGCPACRLGADVVVEQLARVWPEGTGHHVALSVSKACPSDLRVALAALPPAILDDSAVTSLVAALAAFPARRRREDDAAQVVAAYLSCHPLVVAVSYPGLKAHPSFRVAASQLAGGFGPVVDYRVRGAAAWERVRCDAGDPKAQVVSLEGRFLRLS